MRGCFQGDEGATIVGCSRSVLESRVRGQCGTVRRGWTSFRSCQAGAEDGRLFPFRNHLFQPLVIDGADDRLVGFGEMVSGQFRRPFSVARFDGVEDQAMDGERVAAGLVEWSPGLPGGDGVELVESIDHQREKRIAAGRR